MADETLRKYQITVLWSGSEESTTGTIVSAGGVALAVARYIARCLNEYDLPRRTPLKVEWQVIG